jgi:hypothetical protein
MIGPETGEAYTLMMAAYADVVVQKSSSAQGRLWQTLREA